MTISDDLMRKYSDSAVVSVILRPWTDHPNSGEIMPEDVIVTLEHSRRALMPWSFEPEISIWSEYHMEALRDLGAFAESLDAVEL